MSKFTSKQLMEAMGLKVGDKIEVFCGKKIINVGEVFTEKDEAYLRDCGDGHTIHITYILGTEYKILPRYTLTEDEKAIVRNIPKRFTSIKLRCGLQDILISRRDKDGCVSEFTSLPFYELFEFLKNEVEVSLDELRKCL